ncbi:hypothetical protein [Streptomyces alboflavus]|uniref:hypothetical protein n=1 Tax=Streptomyces alboflavus TaxID=67267 RepID=UPI001F280F64|nr:hypothetical protein [Streptomyces alboflavus]
MSTKGPSHSLGPAPRSASGGASEVLRGVGGAGGGGARGRRDGRSGDSLASSVFAVFGVFDAVMVRLSQGW